MTSERKAELARSVKFFLFSISAGVIQILAFTLCEEVFHLPHTVSYVIGLVLSVVWNFTLNRRYTFQSASNVPKAMALVALFYLFFTPASTWWGNALATGAHWNEFLILAFTMAINLTTEFLYDRFVVYRNSMNTNKRANREKNH